MSSNFGFTSSGREKTITLLTVFIRQGLTSDQKLSNFETFEKYPLGFSHNEDTVGGERHYSLQH